MKYCKEVIEDICKFVKAGNNHKDSAILAGLSESTFYEWKSDPKKSEFQEQLKKAEAFFKASMIQVIRKAATGDGVPRSWQAAAWLMERKYQDEFAVKWRMEHEGKNGGPITAAINLIRSKLGGMTKDDLKKLAKEA